LGLLTTGNQEEDRIMIFYSYAESSQFLSGGIIWNRYLGCF